MKLFKKFAGMLLAMIMVLSMSTVAFAAQGTNPLRHREQMIAAVLSPLTMQRKVILTMHTRFWYWKATTQMLVRILTKLMTSGKTG